ncbi:thiaminase II [Cardiobacteriaceae bacterium TAE3-ERU3]|nr:thiaminase II [Cardiobacteriaceae bacterium TAE3-ERU3]
MTTFADLKANCPAWPDYTRHAFVRQLGDGTLAKASFQHYLKQDYLFLLQFTRAWALAVYKSDSFAQMRAGQAGINAMLDMEIALHIDYCAEWGISEAELQHVPESAACVAYTRYVLDCGMTGGLAELYAALLPCIYGYAEIGRELAAQPAVADNPYQAWIDMYSSDEFFASADASRQMFDDLAKDVSPTQAARLQHIFDTATRMEVAFWQMGLDLS